VLRPGGRIRLATPDLKRLLALFTPHPSPAQTAYIDWATKLWIPDAPCLHPTLVLNNMMRNWGHQFVYTLDLLALQLQQAGFAAIETHPVGQSRDPALTGLEMHGRIVGEAPNAFETMVLEAIRPDPNVMG
jgi:predicted SAM-dependent methyltransferase